MNAFTPVTESKHEYLTSVFPMLHSDVWTESPSLTYRAISIWDYWLHEKGNEYLAEPRSSAEFDERCRKFECLDRALLSNTFVYAALDESTWKFGEPKTIDGAAEEMSHSEESPGFLVLLPEMKVIYTTGDNDHHTRTIWYQDNESAAPFFDLVELAGLKIVGSRR